MQLEGYSWQGPLDGSAVALGPFHLGYGSKTLLFLYFPLAPEISSFFSYLKKEDFVVVWKNLEESRFLCV